MSDPDSARALRPLRRFTMPGGHTLLRAVLVTALLGLAAAVLHTPPGCPPSAASSPASAGADGTNGPVDGGGSASADDSPSPDAARSTEANESGSSKPDESATDGGGNGGPPPTGPAGEDRTATGDGPVRPLPLPTGAVGVPIRLAEPAALAVARPGTRVDLLAATPDRAGADAALLAPAALVLDVLGADATDGSTALYLALRPDQAQRAVGLPEGTRFAVVVRG
ncbi:flagellar biosynthesis protein FlgA [Micromonospora sp. WMMD964]|uniref:flagellar biosynthesis protein FlgA n=1 Tax=Micromonospora sp. WMMD964 TaxID=3016091 RepID=UPI00249C30BB|nr:flagellar biosynthesis protein FlgA [Micromonospora sp. WMMD964]WFF02766.1 flagellar biosynthesis protein FlgA [Micromonospora sp. WMMD964]